MQQGGAHRLEAGATLATGSPTPYISVEIIQETEPPGHPLYKRAREHGMSDLTSQDQGYGTPARQGCPFHDIRQKLRRVGLRPTRQRVSLGWVLFAKGQRHVSAEMLFEEAMKERIPVSLATIYNTLRQFTEAGLLRELTLDGAKAYFDTADHDHHHFVVDGENRVIDIPADEIDVASLPVPPAGYEIARVDVVVRLRKIDG
jgi:Fur family iron response transcriptional regulator